MNEYKVNIYIETTIRAPRTGRAAGAYLVEYITAGGIPATRGKIVYCGETTENALVLALINRAFRELGKMCSVRVNTECRHVLNAVKNHWPRQWERNGWMNAKGEHVKNAQLWQQLVAEMSLHLVEFDSGYHSYRDLMQARIWKVLEERR